MNRIYKLRTANYNLRIVKILCVLCLLCGSVFSARAQSTNQSFPTPITTNEISGAIPARDIGDARLTSYFYVFNVTQGDVFINVVTKNLNGDIDVFTADNLRPLTKITIYADASDSETGRVIYMRQPAKLILRIEGRTPNDDPATFRIKFAGSFAPAQEIAANTEPETPTVKSENQTDVRVNSVGTIIEIKPKPTPKPKEIVAEIKERSEEKSETKESDNRAVTEKDKTAESQKETKTVVVITDDLPKKEETETNVKEDAEKDKTVVAKEEETKNETVKKEKPKPVKPLPPAAMENIRLIILFKDGSKIERPMSEVLKVGVDKGVLTVIAKDGTIGRYSILDVEKMTIE
jgi:hypothetical protein